MAKKWREWRSADGTPYRVEVQLAGASSALVVWKHADRARNRYVTWQATEAEARSVTARLGERDVLSRLDDAALATLYRRSAPVSSGATPLGDAT